jgi:putative tryptophan/tyrosine transport system substrate-binding protein
MQRRQFITLLGGVAAAFPLSARAQQPERMRRIGVLMSFAENDPETKTRLTAFRQGLEKRGWSEGRNIHLDNRFTASTQQSTKFETAINLTTAKALGLTVPPGLIVAADEVIE